MCASRSALKSIGMFDAHQYLRLEASREVPVPYELESRLVIGVASSAVFDLLASDAVFQSQGEEEYRKFQQKNLHVPLPKGIAFPFIKRLLSVNDLSVDPTDPLVEVILLSRNDPDTGLRVLKTIEHYGLGMTRAIFMQGKSPYEYIPALNIVWEVSRFAAAKQASPDAGAALFRHALAQAGALGADTVVAVLERYFRRHGIWHERMGPMHRHENDSLVALRFQAGQQGALLCRRHKMSA